MRVERADGSPCTKAFRLWNIIALPLLPLGVGSFPEQAHAEFGFNFTPHIANPSLKQSVANIGCTNGSSTVGGEHGRGTGCGDGGYFSQEIVGSGADAFYHVIIGDPDIDPFAQETYIRSAPGVWFSAKGPANNPMFGAAPLNASGTTVGPLSSAMFPLGPVTLSANGSANPTRVYMKQINQDGQMYLDFTKAKETKKPRIVQIIDDGGILSEFTADASNQSYSQYGDLAGYVNKLTVYDPETGAEVVFGGFDASKDGQNQQIDFGRYIYTEGSDSGGSRGSYSYDTTAFDPTLVKWQNYCNAFENQYRGCVGGPGPGGAGPGGM